MASERQQAHSGNRSLLPELINRLHRAWREVGESQDPVELSTLLSASDGPVSIDDLYELICLDLDYHLRSKRPTRVERYFNAFPQLKQDPQQIDLICEEYRLRQKYGEKPSLGSYGERFPHLVDGLVAKLYSASISSQDHTSRPEGGSRYELDSQNAATLHEKPVSMVASTLGDLYRFIRPLGSGTYGEVWLAEAPGGVEVAIKRLFRTINDAEGKRELQVLELIKRLRHPFLLLTHAYFEQENRLCIVMELADSSLRDRLKECRKEGRKGIPRDELMNYFTEAAEALDYLHSKKIQHRDIKPENILLVERHVKVADFGLARQSKGHEQMEYSIASFCGSPHYIAPEVWAQQITPKSDQYSLAVSYVELKTGQRPFAGSSFQDIMFAHLEADPALGELGKMEQEVLRKALSKDPAERYDTCREFVLALAQATGIKEPGIADTAEMGAVKPSRWPVILLVVLLLLGLGAGGGWLMGWFSKPDPVVEPPPPKGLQLPTGIVAKGDEQGRNGQHKDLPRFLTVKLDGTEINFSLIPGDPGLLLRPFYMMTTEVSVELWEKVASRSEYRACLRKYLGTDDDSWKPEGKLGNWRKFVSKKKKPIRGMTVLEAHCFTEALTHILELKKWAIRLPDDAQWRKASGFYERESEQLEGPFPKGFKAPDFVMPNGKDFGLGQIESKEPLDVGEAKKDVSIYDCRDMTGNVEELTRTLAGKPPGVHVPLRNPTHADQVNFHSRDFLTLRPLRFEDMRDSTLSIPYFSWRETLGFRVVLEMPPG